jgi:hypothetical protein
VGKFVFSAGSEITGGNSTFAKFQLCPWTWSVSIAGLSSGSRSPGPASYQSPDATCVLCPKISTHRRTALQNVQIWIRSSAVTHLSQVKVEMIFFSRLFLFDLM